VRWTSNGRTGVVCMTFSDLFGRWQWRPIHDCPGRYVLTGASPSLSIEALTGSTVEIREFHVETAPDTVLIAVLEDGGLISYRRADGSCLHTLNTAEGFSRKLSQLGIRLS